MYSSQLLRWKVHHSSFLGGLSICSIRLRPVMVRRWCSCSKELACFGEGGRAVSSIVPFVLDGTCCKQHPSLMCLAVVAVLLLLLLFFSSAA